MPNRYEVEIEQHVRKSWAKHRSSAAQTVLGFLSFVIDAVKSLESGFDEQKHEAAKRFTMRHLFLFVPTCGDVAAAERVALDRLNEELLGAK